MRSRWLLCVLAGALLLTPARKAWAQEVAAQPADAIGDELAASEAASDDLGDFILDVDFDMPGGEAPHAPGGGTGTSGVGTPSPGQPGLEMLQRFMQGMGAGGLGNLAGLARPTLREQLALTEEQETRLADIRERRERKAIPIEGDLRLASLDMRKLMRADKPDARAIDAVIDRRASLRATLEKSRAAAALEARAVFTPAQQKVLREYRARHPLLSLGARLMNELMTR